MSAVAYNLKKLLKWQQTKVETAVMSLKNLSRCLERAGKSLCFCFFMLWHSQRADTHVQSKFIFC